MLKNQQFYHATFKKYIILFGSIFNNVIIERKSQDGQTVQTIPVPLNYAPRDKTIERLTADPDPVNGSYPAALNVPRMSFWIENLQYDAHRKLGVLERIVRKNQTDADRFKYVFQQVPYDIQFELWIYVEYAEDAMKIVETILPRFQPEWNATVYLIPELDVRIDVPLEIQSCKPDDQYQASFKDRRINMWKLSFNMKAVFYGPIYNKPIIKFPRMDFFFGDKENHTDLAASVEVSPGLTANGEPTSVANLSIDPHDIFVDDDFGYIVEKSGMATYDE